MQQVKTVLIFIDWFDPGYKAGGPIRSMINMVDHLRGPVNFKIITSDTDYQEIEPYNDILSNQWVQWKESVDVYYLSKDRQNYQVLKKLVEETEFEIAYVNGIYSRMFSIFPLFILKGKKKRCIVAPRGMLSGQAFTSKGFVKKLFLGVGKILALYKHVEFHATTAVETADIISFFSNQRTIHEISNLPKLLEGQVIKVEKASANVKLISIARISAEKNTKYALEVLKLLDEDPSFKGRLQFDIYGSVYQDQYWQECRQIISQFSERIDVQYHGGIEPILAEEKLKQAHVLFMPTTGENFGHAILEALMAGCAVIISDKTPWRKLKDAEVGWDLSLDNHAAFKDAILQVLDLDQQAYDSLRQRCFQYAQKILHQNESLKKAYLSLYEAG